MALKINANKKVLGWISVLSYYLLATLLQIFRSRQDILLGLWHFCWGIRKNGLFFLTFDVL